MLQIASGKFFGDGTINERQCDAIFYSNFSWIAPIETRAGELRPAEFIGGGISSFVLSYRMRYERSSENDVLVMPNGDEAADDFRLLAGFWFKAFFHQSHSHVDNLCRQYNKIGTSKSEIPSHFAGGFFNSNVHAQEDQVNGFIDFIDRVLRIPRTSYVLLMACLRTFFHALESIDTNKDLAYSMFAYALEALTQGSDNFEPTWGNVNQNVRKSLEKILPSLPPETAEAVKSALLLDKNVRVTTRFIDFVSGHVDEKFFTTEATGRQPALRRSLLQQCLANLYNSRSEYVHALIPIQQQLAVPGFTSGDVFIWLNNPYLTFNGLVRLVRHVLMEFIDEQTLSDKEDYPEWRNELSGMMFFEPAPSVWIWNPAGRMIDNVNRRFNGLMHCIAAYCTDKSLIPDMSGVLERFEELLPSVGDEVKLPMLAIYVMFNHVLPTDKRRPKYEKVITTYRKVIDKCSIEMLSVHLLCDEKVPWELSDCEKVFATYQKKRYDADSTSMPVVIDLLVMAFFANSHLEKGDTEKFATWANRMISDAAGLKVQAYLVECANDPQIFALERLLHGGDLPDPPDVSNERMQDDAPPSPPTDVVTNTTSTNDDS